MSAGLMLPAPRSCRWFSLAVLAGLCGCGGGSDSPQVVKVFPVKGKVELADGKPLNGGHIYFVPKGGLTTSDGVIGADGTFSLSTGASGEGAPPGEYKVRVEHDDVVKTATKKGAGKKPPYPPKYADEDGSGLTATVKAEPNQLEPFRLK